MSEEIKVTISDADRKLFNTVYFAAKAEIPSTTINGILALQSMNGVDMRYKNVIWDTITSTRSQ